MQQPYSVQKLVHHPEALESLRARRPQPPTLVHFMPSLACNQHCSFCAVAGTLIETARGRVLIESVKIGDFVLVGSERFRVRDLGSRWADNVQRLKVEGHEVLYVTGEHPIFTRHGFVGADELRAGDRVAADMRVRMRGAHDALPAREEVALEQLRQGTPEPRQESLRGSQGFGFSSDACEEPNEASGDCREGARFPGRQAVRSQRGREPQGLGGGSQAHARAGEPYEGSEDRSARSRVGLLENGEDEDREVVSRGDPGGDVHGARIAMDRSPKPGLSSREAAVCRGDTTHRLQFGESGQAHGGELCASFDRALRGEGLEVPRRLPSVARQEESGDWSSSGDRVFHQGREVGHLRFGEVLVREPVEGRFRVFNLSVEAAEAYVANGILTHNCSYGHRLESDGPEQRGWKNMALMSEAFMPLEKMLECVADWRALGVKAVELTGGGEPLIYPFVEVLLDRLASWGVDLGLVTNGTALKPAKAALFGATRWKWARVSIDAGTADSYSATRRVPRSHWVLAWRAVETLAGLKRDPEQRVGVGYVVDSTNWYGIYEACELALAHGADNVRVALAFTPSNLARFPAGAVEEAARQASAAARDFAGKLQVNDLVSERAGNMDAEVQDYKFCAVKEVLCVVGGDQQVYTCCTLAFNPLGLVGSIKDQSFRELWAASPEFFAGHDARKVCRVPCLYEKRNRRALELMDASPADVAAIAASDPGIHRNFI